MVKMQRLPTRPHKVPANRVGPHPLVSPSSSQADLASESEVDTRPKKRRVCHDPSFSRPALKVRTPTMSPTPPATQSGTTTRTPPPKKVKEPEGVLLKIGRKEGGPVSREWDNCRKYGPLFCKDPLVCKRCKNFRRYEAPKIKRSDYPVYTHQFCQYRRN